MLRTGFLILVLSLPATMLSAATPPHLDRQLLPYGCGTCHVGFDFTNGGGSDLCINCHGGGNRAQLGYVKRGVTMVNVAADFKKPYRHPSLDVKGVHRANEVLPEQDPRAQRHADCVDCHNPHLTSASNPLAGIKGKLVGNLVTTITNEYELCFKCHGDSANLPGTETNTRLEFSTNNPSYHPVEGEGKNLAVVSLIRPYKEKKVSSTDVSTISCHDCHGSDNSSSPTGPHGSAYQHILVDNYSTRDPEQESPVTYALCYRCHSRTSILGDESFRYHSLHIKGTGSGATATGGTSCYTCHSSHGSTEYRYLIHFNKNVVSPSSSGQLKFVERGVSAFSGECYLTCHGVDHNPKTY